MYKMSFAFLLMSSDVSILSLYSLGGLRRSGMLDRYIAAFGGCIRYCMLCKSIEHDLVQLGRGVIDSLLMSSDVSVLSLYSLGGLRRSEILDCDLWRIYQGVAPSCSILYLRAFDTYFGLPSLADIY